MADPRRKRILGDAIVLCPRCGFARRYLLDESTPEPEDCPDCTTALLLACPACQAPIESAMQVDCRECGRALRDGELFGGTVRRKPEPRR